MHSKLHGSAGSLPSREKRRQRRTIGLLMVAQPTYPQAVNVQHPTDSEEEAEMKNIRIYEMGIQRQTRIRHTCGHTSTHVYTSPRYCSDTDSHLLATVNEPCARCTDSADSHGDTAGQSVSIV